ncbi:protein arginine kinase [Savagea sp. SN6]|uniref:Protein-arginine kinase n=1 Tax=Savagea serpentis TaxID=2785297 RepID=A0A8J7G2G6_9BACL|nr:protein arginine kinase [Savagea serpentis]MBF4500935.1 protein arginine kinase [Savagea serpentis]
MTIERFIDNASTGWMQGGGEQSDIVMSTRIRLARNIQGIKFPTMFTKDDAMEVRKRVKEALQEEVHEWIDMNEISALERQVLVEKHIISPDLANKKDIGSVALSEDQKQSILINEEDHLRIQCIYPGLQLERAYEQAELVDHYLESPLKFAFDGEFGYLTSCPSNTGTGMRASVMMHLPALTITRQMERVIPAISRLGIVVRGSYGEGSEAPGNIYQISNQITLGKTEHEILQELKHIVMRLISHERRSRDMLLQQSRIALENKLFRSLGTITYARLLPSSEAAKCLSDVRLGIDLGLIQDVDMSILNELMIFMQPAFLQQYANAELNADERDVFRAKLFRERLHMKK